MSASPEANKAVVRRFVEHYQSGAHDVAVADECLADDFVNYAPNPPFTDDK